MGFTIFLIIFLALVGFLLFQWPGMKPEKRMARMQTINLIANIVTIIGIIVAVVALFYAYFQYHTYKTELARRPNLDLQIAPITRPKNGVFHIEDSNDYSNAVNIGVNIYNKGNLFTSQAFAVLTFNSMIKVLSIEYHVPGLEIPVENRQIFMVTCDDFPLPPQFPVRRFFHFTARLHKACFAEAITVGRYDIQGGGEKYKSLLVEFDPRTESFRGIPHHATAPFKPGLLQLIQE